MRVGIIGHEKPVNCATVALTVTDTAVYKEKTVELAPLLPATVTDTAVYGIYIYCVCAYMDTCVLAFIEIGKTVELAPLLPLPTVTDTAVYKYLHMCVCDT
ncbi:hypothetical protein EVAR_22691_1 [Eumeta japonica]|uniref:Uncharacterized protein n=1 Tax=Eumeta variegata TaxID=151549 RepID=A0A4C1USW1_EUMVA|nr:hypothetical protein EVAR_22691_1 [Eumeta japonica]